MPFTGHVRKRSTKSGITTYQIVVEEDADISTGKRKRYYKTVKGSKKQAEKAMREFITDIENKTFTKDSKLTVKDFMYQWLDLYVKNQIPMYLMPPKMYGFMKVEDVLQDAKDILKMFKENPQNPVHFPGEDNVMVIKRDKAYANTKK